MTFYFCVQLSTNKFMLQIIPSKLSGKLIACLYIDQCGRKWPLVFVYEFNVYNYQPIN